jgi:DNA-binding Lrp family transcriptional regulator
MVNKKERDIASCIQKDIFLGRRPFAYIGDQVGISESEVISVIRGLKEKGVIRRFGAILRHQKAGFEENAMVMWAIPETRLEQAGRTLASYKEITHCYERTPPFDKKYTIFSMVHCAGGGLEEFVQKVSREIDVKDFNILISEEEYKKSSMEYF